MSTDKLTAKASTIVRRPPAEVFAAFADPAAMSKYWFTRRDDGLREGETMTFYLGTAEDSFAFDVLVKELVEPSRIVIEWGGDGEQTQVTWSIEGTQDGDTILAVEESGFTGSDDAIIARALDSTGGFNQVIIAAKALIEHGVAMNVCADHA